MYVHIISIVDSGDSFQHVLTSSQALLQKNVHEPDVLDSRSAVYCKMGLYDKALSDAKRMIKANNQDDRVRQCYFLLLSVEQDCGAIRAASNSSLY